MTLRSSRLPAFVCVCLLSFVARAFGQTPQLVFTAALPEQATAETSLVSSVVEERGLSLWGGTTTDFGVGVSVSRSVWTVRSVASMVEVPLAGQSRPMFQQLEVVRPLFSIGSLSTAAGGGIREEWDGTRVLIGRVLAGTDVGRGRFQGSLVIQRVVSSRRDHDAADVVTSAGWSRPLGRRTSVGIEGIGQDLEGFWDPSEADGGAKLLVGPSIHAQSTDAKWVATLIAGPVVHSPSTWPLELSTSTSSAVGRHFGIFASARWLP